MKLRYNKNKKFKIIQFTDLHLGAIPENEQDAKTYKGIQQIVDENSPDLILFTGDIIYSMSEHGTVNPKESFMNFIQFINKLNVPSAITFGNHDAEEGITKEELRTIYQENATHQATKSHISIIEGRENYVLELMAPEGNEVSQVFYVIDSGDYSHTDHSYYAWVLPEQINWFKNTAENYRHKDQVKRNLMFQHIPIPEYWLASQNIVDGVFNEDIGMNLGWTEESRSNNDISSLFKNGVFSPEINSGLFLQMLLNEEIWGMFVGHDHDNTFDGIYKGIHLVYGQSSGYNTYGSEPKGARIIELNQDKNRINTYPVFYE